MSEFGRKDAAVSSAEKDPFWYKRAIIYELHVRSFFDGNGDGTGDFQGLTQKLDYLQELGITAIWLLPFYPSPLRDDGYDIADYYSINPIYGSINDFRHFLQDFVVQAPIFPVGGRRSDCTARLRVLSRIIADDKGKTPKC